MSIVEKWKLWLLLPHKADPHNNGTKEEGYTIKTDEQAWLEQLELLRETSTQECLLNDYLLNGNYGWGFDVKSIIPYLKHSDEYGMRNYVNKPVQPLTIELFENREQLPQQKL